MPRPPEPVDTAELLAAFDEVLAVLDELVERRTHIVRRTAAIRRRLDGGEPLAEVVLSEPPPVIVAVLRDLSGRLVDAFSRLQRAEAQTLHRSGLSMERIGELFGVSRQRIADLVRGR